MKCKYCGHPIHNENLERDLTPHQRNFYNILQKAGSAGLQAQDIADRLWAHDPNGGPVWARNCVSVMKRRINTKLRKHKIQVVTTVGAGHYYRLEVIGE